LNLLESRVSGKMGDRDKQHDFHGRRLDAIRESKILNNLRVDLAKNPRDSLSPI